MEKLIFTIDLDAFFASCEEIKKPEIKNKPMVVGKELNGRGVVSSANYLARKYGIKSSTPFFKAKQLCPNLVILDTDFDFYEKMSNKVFNVIESFTKIIEIGSIDECYVDVTFLTKKNKPIEIAKMIKKKIKEETGLIVSIGISTNILLSKIASGFDKPNGITTLYKHEIKEKLWPLDLIKMHMLGPSTKEKLNSENIMTIGELSKLKSNRELYEKLKNKIGISIDKIIDGSKGIDNREIIVNEKENKSISKEKTFENSLNSIELINEEMRKLFEYVFKRLKERKLCGTTITIFKKRDGSFLKNSLSRKLVKPTSDKTLMWSTTEKMIDSLCVDKTLIKQIGFSISGLKNEVRSYSQLTIDNIDYCIKKGLLHDIVYEAERKFETMIVIGSEMKDNKKFDKNKRLIDSSNIKFKKW